MSSTPPPTDKDAAREAKLAQALRTNLRRRKAAGPAPAAPGARAPATPGDGDSA